MKDGVYEVHTDMDPDQLTEVAVETYRKWLAFALGRENIGGKTLANTSGRYAASISWKRTGRASIAIIADEGQAPEGGAIEYGRPAIDMKSVLLGSKAKMGKDGYLYRNILLRRDNAMGPAFDMAGIVGGDKGERLPAKTGKLWAVPRSSRDSKSGNWRQVSNRPGSSSWAIPEFKPYAPARILAELIYNNSKAAAP